MSKFEQAESLLKNVNIIIPSKALAIHLLGKSNLNPQSKENVLTKTELDGDAIYSSLKKSFREMKSDLTTTAVRKDSDKVFTARGEDVNNLFLILISINLGETVMKIIVIAVMLGTPIEVIQEEEIAVMLIDH